MPPKGKGKAPAKKGAAKPAAASSGKDEVASAIPKETYRMSTGTLLSQPTALDVKIGGFSLQSYGKQLIKDTTLEFTIGRRYGLIGANGSGKSQFLRSLAFREVPIPDFMDIYLLDNEAEPSDMRPVDWVVDQARKEVKRLEERSEQLLEEEGPDSEVLNDIYARLDGMDPDTFESRAGRLLTGLGFGPDMMEKQTKDMSGGWRMRVALAKALFIKPTLLLLDEPTNHLDLEACVWLENYLAEYDRCLIVISHSQDFLNGVCTHIIHLTPKKDFVFYTGNYDMFIQTKAELEVNQMKKYEKEQADIAHIKKFVASAGTYANLVRQAKSKLKIIERMEEAGLTEKVEKEFVFKFRFPEAEKLPPPVLALDNVSFAYSGNMKDCLYTNLQLGVDMDSRIALVGPNGAGKSTLLKLMLGELRPVEGDVKRHLHVNIARYNQHSNDQLDPSKKVLDFVRDTYPERKWDEQEWRSQVGKYGLGGALQTTKIGELSDGMKSRVVFCILALKNPHLLLLDEPTNHLDMECIDSLAEAINHFNGGLMLVSHDFRLISQVAKEIWICDNKTVTRFSGDIRAYKQLLVTKMKKAAAAYDKANPVRKD